MSGLIKEYLYKPFSVYTDKLERAVYIILFLFPIAGMSIRHWISTIFVLLALIGLFTLGKRRDALMKEEKIFLWICVAYMAAFIVSSLVNGWCKPQTHYLGTELRFLAVIPVFLLLRHYGDSAIWLLRGALVAGFVLAGQAIYDVFILKLPYANGVYSKNIIGPMGVLVVFWTLAYAWFYQKRLDKVMLGIIAASIVGALLTIGLSTSRGAYVGFVLTALACVLFLGRPKWMLMAATGSMIVAAMLYFNIGMVKYSVDNAYEETLAYVQAEDHVFDDSSSTSIGVRLEMWRLTRVFLRDHLVFGVGPGNYRKKMLDAAVDGEVSNEVINFENPHNAYLEALTSKGMLGLIALLLLLYYPAYIYIRDYKKHKATAVYGLIHIVAISAFSLTDHSVIVKNNYTSLVLLGLAIFLASHFKQRRNNRENHG